MQRVLFVTPHLYVGGAERVLSYLAAALGVAGYGVDIVSVTRGREPDCFDLWLRTSGATITRVAPVDLVPLLDRWPLGPVRALVFLGTSPAMRLAPRLHARRPGLRMVGFAFNPVDGVGDLAAIGAHLAVIITESLQAAAALGPQARYANVPSGIDPGLVEQNQPRPPRPWLEVGFIGRMDATKNVEMMVQIAKLLPPDRFRFQLYGDGPLRRDARRQAWRTCPHHSFRWHGRVSDDALAKGFCALDVLIVPSVIDGRPLVISEAQLRGVAVVASHTGAIPDLVTHDETGLLCPPRDAGAFAKALRHLADDRAMMIRLVTQARQVALAREAPADRIARYLAAILGT